MQQEYEAQRERQWRQQNEQAAQADHTLARITLGLGSGLLTTKEIRAAYRAKAMKLRPDKGGDSDTMSALAAARDALLA